VLWNKSVPWILLPCALLYLANAGTSPVYYLNDISLTCLALSIVAIYGNGWAHNDAFPTLKVTVVYNWMWLGSQSFRSHHSPRTGSDTDLSQRISYLMPWSLYGCSG
jgi:hypothetical protein